MTKKPRKTDATPKATRPRKAPQAGTRAPKPEKATDTVQAAPDATSGPCTRAGSKQAKLIEMLRRSEGATVDEIVAAFNW
jgi:hypothetical protein